MQVNALIMGSLLVVGCGTSNPASTDAGCEAHLSSELSSPLPLCDLVAMSPQIVSGRVINWGSDVDVPGPASSTVRLAPVTIEVAAYLKGSGPSTVTYFVPGGIGCDGSTRQGPLLTGSTSFFFVGPYLGYDSIRAQGIVWAGAGNLYRNTGALADGADEQQVRTQINAYLSSVPSDCPALSGHGSDGGVSDAGT